MHSSRQIGVCELRLQLGVIDDVVVAQRLLDHHQVELVEPLQVLGVRQRVRGVRVRHQLDRGKPLAHPPHHVHIPARLDLHLDALVAGRQFAFDLLEQLLHRILNADRNAARDLAPRAAADLLPQRHAVAAAPPGPRPRPRIRRAPSCGRGCAPSAAPRPRRSSTRCPSTRGAT